MTTTTAAKQSSYVPGVCNINHAEIARRRRIGYIGLAVMAVLFALLTAFHLKGAIRIVLFFPAFIAASGFLQARYKFCSGYGSSGRQNAQEGSTTATAVTDDAAIQKDKNRAVMINMQAAVIALIASAVALLLS
ncbi:MAG TPA: hypothetical protein VMS08_02010 [Candidatus Saccharimonadia bacterium]|jgi:hypothetical protein|nr:hypothetical protein [Candidatus Saccharimonadia bacterium]